MEGPSSEPWAASLSSSCSNSSQSEVAAEHLPAIASPSHRNPPPERAETLSALDHARIWSAAFGFWLAAMIALMLALHLLIGVFCAIGACWLALALLAPSRLPPRAGPDELEACERAYVAEAFPSRTRSVWTLADGCALHSLVISCSGASRGTLLVLHGTSSSAALLMASCARGLARHFDVHALDLPGYGLSTAEGLGTASAERTLDLVCAALDAYCTAHGLEHVCLVGHSIGAFYALHWARRSARVSRVALVNPAGLLPMLGPQGARWAVLFKLGLPGRPLRALGAHAALLLWPLLRAAPLRRRYWACLQRARGQQHLVGRFLDVRFSAARWTLPAAPLAAELAAQRRLALVWTRGDAILPVQQGRFLAGMLGLGVEGDGYVELDGPHGPFHEQGGAAISAALLEALPAPPLPEEQPGQPAALVAGALARHEREHARVRRAARLAAMLPSSPALRGTCSYFHTGVTRAALARSFAQLAALAELAGDGAKDAALRALGEQAAWGGR